MPASSGSAARPSSARTQGRARRGAARQADGGPQGGRCFCQDRFNGAFALHQPCQERTIQLQRIGPFQGAGIGKQLAQGAKLAAPGGRNGNQGCNAGAGDHKRSESGEHGESLSEDKRAGTKPGDRCPRLDSKRLCCG